MSLRFVHFEHNASSSATAPSTEVPTEKTLHKLHQLYLTTLHLHMTQPTHPSIPTQYKQILADPLMRTNMSAQTRDLRMDLREACCWGLACYNNDLRRPHEALAWMLKNLASRIHLWRHPNCIKVLGAIADLAWENEWYHVARNVCETLLHMISAPHGTEPHTLPSLDHALLNRIQHMHTKILYIIGEWYAMVPALKSLAHEQRTSTTHTGAPALLWSAHSFTSTPINEQENAPLSSATIQRLLLLDSSASTDLPLTYQIQQMAQLHLPNYLKERRANWIHNLQKKRDQHLHMNASTPKPLSIRVSLPLSHIDPFAALGRDLFMHYKRRCIKSLNLNDQPVRLKIKQLSPLKKVTLQQLDPSLTQHGTIKDSSNTIWECNDASNFDSLPVKRKRDGTISIDEEPLSKYPKHFSLDVRNLNLLEGLKDVFEETRWREANGAPQTDHPQAENDGTDAAFSSASHQNKDHSPAPPPLRSPLSQKPSTALNSSQQLSNHESSFATLDQLHAFVQKMNEKQVGLLDLMHDFVEHLVSHHSNNRWSNALVTWVRRMAKYLFQNHGYTFSPKTSLYCAELFLDKYDPASDKDTVLYKVLGHKFLAQCSLKDATFSEKCRIFYAYGIVVARSNPVHGIDFFTKCLHMMVDSETEYIDIPHVTRRERNLSIEHLSDLLKDMRQEVELYNAEEQILKGKYKEGLHILERYISVESTQHITVMVRDLQWVALLEMDPAQFMEMDEAPSLLHFLLTKTELPILSNYSNANFIFGKLWRIVESGSLTFSDSERTDIMRRLMEMLQMASDDFNVSRSTQFHKLAALVTHAVLVMRKIGTFSGESHTQQCFSSYRSVYLLQSMLITQLSVPRSCTYFDLLIHEYFAIFKMCSKQLEKGTSTSNEWFELRERVKFGAAVCFYALYGIILVNPRDGRFIRWKQIIDVRCAATGPRTHMDKTLARIAFCVIEQLARNQVEYGANDADLLDIYGVLSVLFPPIFSFDSPFERQVAEIETNHLPWDDFSNAEKVPQGSLDDLIPDSSDRDFLMNFNSVMAKAQMRYADTSFSDEERFARYSEALNIIRRSLGLSPQSAPMWTLLGELYSTLTQLHSDSKLKRNEIILTQNFRSNLLITEENPTVDTDLEQCAVRALRCFFIALTMDPKAHSAAYAIPSLLHHLLSRKIAVPNAFGDLTQMTKMTNDYITRVRTSIQGVSTLYWYKVLFLNAQLCTELSTLDMPSQKKQILAARESFNACKQYLYTAAQCSLEKEMIKRDLSRILCHWCSIFVYGHDTARKAMTDKEFDELISFYLAHVYRWEPLCELDEGPNVGYLQGYAIPSTYAEITPVADQPCNQSTSIILLYNLLYQAMHDALKLDPFNHVAVHQMSYLIATRNGPWHNHIIAQKVCWTLFKQKLTGTTRRPEFFELSVKDLVLEKKIIVNMLRKLKRTRDVRLLSILLAGLRRSYLAYGSFAIDHYIQGINLLINHAKDQLQELKEKGKKLSGKERLQLFREIATAYVYIRDPELEEYASENDKRKGALRVSEDLLKRFVKEHSVKISLNGDDDEIMKALLTYHKQKGLNLSRRTRTSRKMTGRNSKMLSTGIHVVQLKSLQERTLEAESGLSVEGDAMIDDEDLDELEGEDLFEEEGESDEGEDEDDTEGGRIGRASDDDDEESDNDSMEEEEETNKTQDKMYKLQRFDSYLGR